MINQSKDLLARFTHNLNDNITLVLEPMYMYLFVSAEDASVPVDPLQLKK